MTVAGLVVVTGDVMTVAGGAVDVIAGGVVTGSLTIVFVPGAI